MLPSPIQCYSVAAIAIGIRLDEAPKICAENQGIDHKRPAAIVSANLESNGLPVGHHPAVHPAGSPTNLLIGKEAPLLDWPQAGSDLQRSRRQNLKRICTLETHLNSGRVGTGGDDQIV